MTDNAGKQTKAASGLKGVGLLAVILGCLFLVVEIISWIWHLLTNKYDAIYIPPRTLSEGLFWGLYAVYGAIIIFQYAMLDKFEIVETAAGWLSLILIAIAAIVVPLAFFAVPNNTTDIYGDTTACGSWFSPSSDLPGSSCASSLDGASRDAMTSMAIGIGIPFVLMGKRVYLDRKEAKKQGKA
jgi:hypothetical protein